MGWLYVETGIRMTPRTEPTKAEIRKWCKALRSGEYRQGLGRLQSKNNFCCLGVAVDQFVPKKHQWRTKGEIQGGEPACHDHAPEWLKKISLRFEKTAGDSLINLNDMQGFTFDEIADCLEAVYIHEVLG